MHQTVFIDASEFSSVYTDNVQILLNIHLYVHCTDTVTQGYIFEYSYHKNKVLKSPSLSSISAAPLAPSSSSAECSL